MKQIKLFSVMLLLATMFVGFTACSDDNDNGIDDLKSYLIGTWQITAWESNEGEPNEGVGTQFTLNANGSITAGGVNAGTWHIHKKGTALQYEYYNNVTLQYDAIVWEEKVGDLSPIVILLKERKSDTVQVSLLEFELSEDDSYSRGTLKKIK